MQFNEKVVIITGAGAGMGKAAAIAFSREGACVIVNDINEGTLSGTVFEIESAGGSVTAVKGDATKSGCADLVVGRALKDHGRVDILFNYVGGMPPGISSKPFIDNTEAVWDAIIELNLKSPMLFTRAVLDLMIKQKYGKIINTASGAGKTGSAGMAAYATTKGGIIAFTKSIAREVAPFNINVNCVCPGFVATPSLVKSMEARPDLLKTYESTIPFNRLGRPEEIADTVLFLASDEAAYITGQAFSIDGGQVMM